MKWFIRIILLLMLLAILLTLFAPAILSTTMGKQALFQVLKNSSGYEIHVEELKLHWTEGQSAKHVAVLDSKGQLVFRADSMTSTAPLWKLIFHDVGHLRVEAPTVVIEPSHKLSSKLVMQQAGVGTITIAPSMPVLGEISVSQGEVQFVTPGIDALLMKEVELQATLLPKQLKVQTSGITEEGSKQGTFQIDFLACPGLDQMEATIQLVQFPLRAADQIVSVLYPDLRGVIRETVGDTVNAEIKLHNFAAYVKATSDLFSATLETEMRDSTLELVSPALVQFQVAPKLFEKLTTQSIKSAVVAQLKIDQLSVPVGHLDQLKIQGTLKSSAVEFEEWTLSPFSLYVGSTPQSEWNIKLDSAQAQFQGILDLPSQWENLSLKGEALLPNNAKLELAVNTLESITATLQKESWKGQLKGSFDPKTQVVKGTVEAPAFQYENTQLGASLLKFSGNLNSKTAQFFLTSTVEKGSLALDGTFSYPQNLKIQGSCNNFPVASLQPFMDKVPSLGLLLGDFLTTNFQLDVSEQARLLKLNTSSSNLTLKASLKEQDKKFELVEPASFIWTMTPQYNPLLLEPAIFTGSMTVLSFNYDQILDSIEYQGKITSDTLLFGSSLQKQQLSQIQINVNHPNQAAPHQFHIAVRATPQGSLLCQGTWTPAGSANIKLSLERFPSATFDFFTAPFSLPTFCGPSLNMSLETTLSEWTGPLSVELHSAHLRSSLKGALSQGSLTLTDTFHLQLNVTKQLSEMLFGATTIRSEGPVTLEIAKEGFSYPLFPTNLSKIQVGAGRLELGKLKCENKGNVQMAIALLKQQLQQGDLELWCAPLDFQVQNGILKYERTEILVAHQFQICTWGKVDFSKNSVDGIVGLTSSCLNRAFKIQNLPENYVLQIPLRGTLTDVKIDKDKATAKITALLLWQQKDALGDVVGGAVKGPAGKLLGQTLSKLGPLPGGDEKAPPPKKPFPWEKEEPKSKQKTSHVHKTLIHPSDSALKQALKLIK